MAYGADALAQRWNGQCPTCRRELAPAARGYAQVFWKNGVRNPSRNAAKSLQAQQRGAKRYGIATKSRRGIELVPIADVRYFKAEHKYVTMHHATGAALINETLRSLEAEFQGILLRVHRHTLVAIRHVVAMQRSESSRCYQLKLADLPTPIRVSRRRATAVRRALGWAPSRAAPPSGVRGGAAYG